MCGTLAPAVKPFEMVPEDEYQVVAERRHSAVRRRLLKLDNDLGDMLSFSGRAE